MVDEDEDLELPGGVGGVHGGADRIVVTSEAEAAEPVQVGALGRHEQALRQPEVEAGAHLGETLQSGIAGLRGATGVRRAGDVAEAEPGVIVGRTDQTVEVDFSDHG